MHRVWKERLKVALGIVAAAVVEYFVLDYVLLHRKPKFKCDLTNIASCKRCHRLMDVRAGTSYLQHLMDDHGCDFDQAEAAVRESYRRLLRKIGEHNERTSGNNHDD